MWFRSCLLRSLFFCKGSDLFRGGGNKRTQTVGHHENKKDARQEMMTNSRMSDPLVVDKVINGKYVKVGGDRVGYTCRGVWTWTKLGESSYPQDFRAMAKSYAENE